MRNFKRLNMCTDIVSGTRNTDKAWTGIRTGLDCIYNSGLPEETQPSDFFLNYNVLHISETLHPAHWTGYSSLLHYNLYIMYISLSSVYVFIAVICFFFHSPHTCPQYFHCSALFALSYTQCRYILCRYIVWIFCTSGQTLPAFHGLAFVHV